MARGEEFGLHRIRAQLPVEAQSAPQSPPPNATARYRRGNLRGTVRSLRYWLSPASAFTRSSSEPSSGACKRLRSRVRLKWFEVATKSCHSISAFHGVSASGLTE